MYSRGITTRTVRHPILQDGTRLILSVRQRRWRCRNCRHEENDRYSFLQKNKQLTSFIPYLICRELKDYTLTCSSVAKRFHVTSQAVFNYFMQYVDLKRLPLPQILSVDEVYLNIDDSHKYAFVLMDFQTGEIVDMVISRRKTDTERYFMNIPFSERKEVRYLVCDMYNPYINYTKGYFYHAEAVVDSFHVVQWLNNMINSYIDEVKKRYQKRDRENTEKENKSRNIAFEKQKDSKEVYLLKNFRWVLLKNERNIQYTEEKYYNLKLCQYVNTHILIDLFMSLDSQFEAIRNYRNIYIDFNERNSEKNEECIDQDWKK